MPVKTYKDILHKATNLSFPIFLKLLCLDSNSSAVLFFFFVN